MSFPEKNIVLKILSGEEEITLVLSKFDTVGYLKEEIRNCLNVDPQKQLLHGWNIEPDDDNNILEFCGISENGDNFLVLYEADPDNFQVFNSNSNTDETSSLTKMDVTENDAQDHNNEPSKPEDENNDHIYNFQVFNSNSNTDETSLLTEMDVTEGDVQDNNNEPTKPEDENNDHILIESACSFVDKFTTNYSDTPVIFHINTLTAAIAEATQAPLDKKRILLLYFHNDENEFSKIFCENLSNQDISEVLSKYFYLIAWDLEDQYQSALVKALKTSYELSCSVNLVTRKISMALLLVPVRDTFALFSCMKGEVSRNDFITTLKNAADYLIEENKQEQELLDITQEKGSENDIGSKEYQQIMLNNLGDRDFDCYQSNEHEFLKKKIGYALFGPPESESGYNKKQSKKIEKLYTVILSENYENDPGFVVMKIIFNCTEPLPAEKNKRAKKYKDYNPNVDVCPFPIFIMRRCRPNADGCRRFIDHTGRVYISWNEYISRNRLAECEMVLPRNGTYACDDNGQVLLERHLSPACGIDSKILDVSDVSSTVVGLASGGVIGLSLIPAVTVAPAALVAAGVAGLGVGVYAIGRSAYKLYDKNRHKESMSFADSEARGAYINIVAGSLGFVGAGANVLVSQMAARGVDIWRCATIAVDGFNIANITFSGVAIVNSSYDVIDQLVSENQTPTPLMLLQLSSSILFFGHAMYSFKTTGTIISEAQNGVLNEYQRSLSSNRQRKTFNKLLRETINSNNGDVSRGQAQVIRAIRSMQNREEVFATLTRGSKTMNKKGMKLSAEDGQIMLNGQRIDIHELSTLNKKEMNNYLSNLPEARELTPSEVNTFRSDISSTNSTFSNLNINIQECVQLFMRCYNFCEGDVKAKIFEAAAQLINALLMRNFNILREISEIIPNCYSPFFEVSRIVTHFFEKMAIDIEVKYENWLQTQDPQYDSPLFHMTQVDMTTAVKRFLKFFAYVVQRAFAGPQLTEIVLRDLIKFTYEYIAEQICQDEKKDQEMQESSSSIAEGSKLPIKIDCEICGGFYYQVKK